MAESPETAWLQAQLNAIMAPGSDIGLFSEILGVFGAFRWVSQSIWRAASGFLSDLVSSIVISLTSDLISGFTRPGDTIPFITGWLDKSSDEVWGRPVDIEELPDGSILISDDYADAIYRVSYEGK